MWPRGSQFEYRAWPSERMPHIEALHYICGIGVAEIRTDTYIVSPSRSQWLMIVRGGTHFEIKVKTGVHGTVTAWQRPLRTTFPLRRGVVSLLQDAFPMARLPNKILAPVDLISWLGSHASICTVSKRMARFNDGHCIAELTQIETNKRRVETFCLRARRPQPILETLEMIPGPRLPNLDYGAWMACSAASTQPAPLAIAAPLPPVCREPDPLPDSPRSLIFMPGGMSGNFCGSAPTMYG